MQVELWMVRKIPELQTVPVLVSSTSSVTLCRLNCVVSSTDCDIEQRIVVTSTNSTTASSRSSRYFQLAGSVSSTVIGLTRHPRPGPDRKSWPKTEKVEQFSELTSQREFLPAITGNGVGVESNSGKRDYILSRYFS